MVRSWLNPVQAEVDRLRQSAAAGEGSNLLERQRQFEARAAAIRGEARSIAARSNELGKSTATEMRALASSVAIAPGQAGFSCYDPTLAERLTQAAAQAERPAELTLREAAFNEGPAGVANAVKKLWANVGSYLSGAVRYVFSAGRATADTKTGEPISGRDLIALLATIGIDLGLLAMAALNPPPAAPGRRDGLAGSHARLRLPSAAVIQQLSAAFETAIAKAPEANLDWVRRHFIHHGDCSYFVIPNLYSVDKADEREELRALAINQLAGVLADLNLVRPLTASELKRFARDETRTSYGDLAALREEHAKARTTFERKALPWKMWVRQAGVGESDDRLRNHGLLSKAQRALDIAGWSVDRAARRRGLPAGRLRRADAVAGLVQCGDPGQGRGVHRSGTAGAGAARRAPATADCGSPRRLSSCCQEWRTGQHGHPWMVVVAGFHAVHRHPVADLVLDQRLGVDAPADRVAGDRHLLPEVRLAASACGNLEAKPGIRGFFRRAGSGRATQMPLSREVVQTVRVVKVKEFGDVNISTLLSLLMLAGLILAARI